MKRKEKLSILIRDFKKLDDTRKDYIGELTRILADIHCGKFSINSKELGKKAFKKSDIPISNINYNQGVLV